MTKSHFRYFIKGQYQQADKSVKPCSCTLCNLSSFLVAIPHISAPCLTTLICNLPASLFCVLLCCFVIFILNMSELAEAHIAGVLDMMYEQTCGRTQLYMHDVWPT